MAECVCWIYVFKLAHFVRHYSPYYYHGFDDSILRIFRAKSGHSITPVFSQTSNLASFTVEIATRFFSLLPEKIAMRNASYKKKGPENVISTGLLNSQLYSRPRIGNGDNDFLAFALCILARASLEPLSRGGCARFVCFSSFRADDSLLPPFRNFASVFSCRLTGCGSFGCSG